MVYVSQNPSLCVPAVLNTSVENNLHITQELGGAPVANSCLLTHWATKCLFGRVAVCLVILSFTDFPAVRFAVDGSKVVKVIVGSSFSDQIKNLHVTKIKSFGILNQKAGSFYVACGLKVTELFEFDFSRSTQFVC